MEYVAILEKVSTRGGYNTRIRLVCQNLKELTTEIDRCVKQGYNKVRIETFGGEPIYVQNVGWLKEIYE